MVYIIEYAVGSELLVGQKIVGGIQKPRSQLGEGGGQKKGHERLRGGRRGFDKRPRSQNISKNYQIFRFYVALWNTSKKS